MTLEAAPQASPTTQAPATNPNTSLPTTPTAVPETVTGSPSIPNDELSSKFAALARQEKKNSAERKRLDDLAKKYGPLEERITKGKENPLAYLEAAGISIDDLIQFQLKQGKPPTAEDKVMTIEEKLKKLEQQLADKETQSEQERINKNVQTFKSEIRAHTEADKDKYELINVHDAHDLVYDECSNFWSAQEDVEPAERTRLEISKAADIVEDKLYQASLKFKDVKKYRSLYAPEIKSEPTDIKPKAQDSISPQTEQTLTNRGPTPSANASSKVLPRELAIKQIASQFDRKL